MSERWAQVWVDLPSSAVEAVSAVAFAAGCAGTQEDLPPGVPLQVLQPWEKGPPPPPPAQVRFRMWFAEDDAGTARAALRDAVANIAGAGEVQLQWDDEQDWAEAWRAGFERLEVGRGIAVAAPWNAQPGDLIIEPGLAFGTGEHPTTRACLRGVIRYAVPGQRVLDVGCGTGVLALAGARLGMEAMGTDIDPDAVRIAAENATLNGLVATFTTAPLAAVTTPADLVVANIFAEVLVTMADDFARLCTGHLVLAGILADRAHLVVDALTAFTVVERVQEGDWVHLDLVPRS